jgi:hypothetical protein
MTAGTGPDLWAVNRLFVMTDSLPGKDCSELCHPSAVDRCCAALHARNTPNNTVQEDVTLTDRRRSQQNGAPEHSLHLLRQWFTLSDGPDGRPDSGARLLQEIGERLNECAIDEMSNLRPSDSLTEPSMAK